jgi:limonene-1,2-epoxide hydrolase
MNTLGLRNAVNVAMLAARLHERQQRQTEFADEFDITTMPYKTSKVYPKRRDPSTLGLCVVHVTDVTGGFGVSKRRVQHWTDALDQGGVPELLLMQLPNVGDVATAARRLALWERYRSTPYHRIGAANGDNIRNHPLGYRTKHGNAGNAGAGWALDVGHDQELDKWHIDTGRASLTSLLKEMNDLSGRTIRVVPHRCYSAGRRNDPGRRVWLAIVRPVVQMLAFAEIDYLEARDGGRPVPRSWDPEARFDDRGRRSGR